MLACLTLEANPGRDKKFLIRPFEAIGQVLLFRDCQYDTEMPGRHPIPIDWVRIGRRRAIDQMPHHLVPKKIQINPARCRTSLNAAETATIKRIGSCEVGDLDGRVK